MFTYRRSSEAPHIFVEADGIISGVEVHRELAGLSDDLEAMPPGFVVVVQYPGLIMLKPGAIGALFYYIARVFDTDPGLFILVDGGRSPYPGLRAFINQIDVDHRVRAVATREEADALIRDFVADRYV